MSWSRLDLLASVKAQGDITPMSETDFRQHCHNWLLEKFPNLATGNYLVDGKSVEKWLDYIAVETKNRWINKASRTWNTLLGPKCQTFTRIEVKVSQAPTFENETEMDTTFDDGMDIDVNEVPVDLKDLSIFQYFNCPKCDFKSADRIQFKEHVIRNHDYIKGKMKSTTKRDLT